MTVDLTVLVITSLGGVVATLAGIIYAAQRRELALLKKENRELAAIVLSEAAKESETVAQFARLWAKQNGGEE